MSLLLVVCEKYKSMVKDLKLNINKIIASKNIDAQIRLATDNPMEVLQYSTKRVEIPNINAYILCLHESAYEKSIQMARVIRGNDINSYIVFVANSNQFCELIIKNNIELFDYMVTPLQYEDIEACICALYRSYSRHILCIGDKNTICIRSGNQSHKLTINQIIYIESFEQKIIIHTINKSVECFGYLKDIIKALNKGEAIFYRCHRSYVININHIKEVNFKDMCIQMSNEDKCYLSRQKKKEIMELLENSKTVAFTVDYL